MDKDTLLEALPHYAVMLLVVFLAITVLGSVFGELGFWVEFVVILAIVFAYPPVVRQLGVEPSIWEKE